MTGSIEACILEPLKSSSNNANLILLLDDEFDITTALKQSLEKRGFRVVGFTDPLLALRHFQINHKQYELVISDLRMPGINGYEFMKKVKKIKPEVKVCLMTAFEIKCVEFQNLLHSVKIDELIQKPVSFEELARIANKCVNIPSIRPSRSQNTDKETKLVYEAL